MTTVRQLNVSGGELSPALYSRTDTSKFQAGFRTARNVVIRKDGAIENRQGGEKVGTTSRNRKVVVIEFKVTREDSFQVELSHLKLRILRRGVPTRLISWGEAEIFSVTKANPGVLKFSGANVLTNGQEVYVTGVLGMTELNNRTFVVAGYDNVNKTFNLVDDEGNNVDTTNYGTFVASTSGIITRNVSFNAPFTEDEIPFVDYDQSIDVMKLVHINHPPAQLKRNPTDWTVGNTPFGLIPAPVLTGLTLNLVGAGGTQGTIRYAVTSVLPDGTETGAAAVTGLGNVAPSGTLFNQLGWDAPNPNMVFYIYKEVYGVFGLIGTVKTTVTGYQANQFRDIGVVPDTTHSLLQYLNPFDAPGNYPSAVCFFQQRTVYANTLNKPETVFASQAGVYDSFIKRSPGDPIRDSDSIEFSLAGRSINPVNNLFDLSGLVMMTETSEQYLGNQAMTPSTIHPTAQSYNGNKKVVKPIPMNNTLLYLQALGSVVRELGFEYQSDGYRGDDLTTFSSHLFKNKQIVSWGYQSLPNSVLWAVRNDGTFLTLTHVKEQQIMAWTRHDVEGGFVENAFCAREGQEDTVYLVVRRVVDGVTKRCYERLPSRAIEGISDARMADGHVQFDGTNKNPSLTMKINDPSGQWDYQTTMDLQSSANYFAADFVGRQIHIYQNGEVIRFTINGYTDAQNVTGTPHKTVPVSMQNVALSSWGLAQTVVSGLDHLNGQKVSAIGDGDVIASPHNSTYEFVLTVANGKVTLDKPYVKGIVGMPITADLETLNIDTVDGETMVDKFKQISKLTMQVDMTRGLFAGPQAPTGSDYLDHLTEIKPRFNEGYDQPNRLISGTMDVIIESQWNSNGRVFIRQVDPLPMTVLSIAPAGLIPFNL